MNRLTFRARVTLASALVLAAGLIVGAAAINLLLAARLNSDAEAALRARASAQLVTIEITGSFLRLEEAPSDGALDAQSWIFAGPKLVERAPAPADVLRSVYALMGVDGMTERTVGDLRLLALPVRARRSSTRVGTVIVGISLLPYRHSQHIALAGTGIFCLLLLLLVPLAVQRTARAALRPVAEMTRDAAEWGETDLHRRFRIGPIRDELAGLAATFNGLLTRLEGALNHEQRLTAELAHELRTPLAGIRAEAELALRLNQGVSESDEGLQRILLATDQMNTVIESLLTGARADLGTSSGRCEVGAVVGEAVDSIRTAADAAQKRVDVVPALGAIQVQAEPGLVQRALQPVLENAVRHARAHVTISLSREDGFAHIVVCDDGSGPDDNQGEEVFVPGFSTSGGAGLGLPLARRLARSCGGDLVVRDDLDGGAFDLSLPQSDVQVPFR